MNEATETTINENADPPTTTGGGSRPIEEEDPYEGVAIDPPTNTGGGG